jgi:hypothetical protein
MGDKIVDKMVNFTWTFGEAYERFKDSDGFLYIYVTE